MNLVYENRNNTDHISVKKDGVLKTWLMSNSTKTIPLFLKLEEEKFKNPWKVFFIFLFFFIYFVLFTL